MVETVGDSVEEARSDMKLSRARRKSGHSKMRWAVCVRTHHLEYSTFNGLPAVIAYHLPYPFPHSSIQPSE